MYFGRLPTAIGFGTQGAMTLSIKPYIGSRPSAEPKNQERKGRGDHAADACFKLGGDGKLPSFVRCGADGNPPETDLVNADQQQK